MLSDERTSLGVVAEQANILQVHNGKAEVVAFALRLRGAALSNERHC